MNHTPLRIIVTTAILSLVAIAACGKDSTAPVATPTSVNLVESGTQQGVVGKSLTVAPTFTVKDQNGNGMGGVPVTITVTVGGGTLLNAPTTTVSGGATSVGTWTLGTIVGVNKLTIKAGNLSEFSITVNSLPGPAAQITVDAGNNQLANAGTDLLPITVHVRDQYGNVVPTVNVLLTVSGGGGTVHPASATSDAAGAISGILWRLGKSAIAQSLAVSTVGAAVSVPATVFSGYDPVVRFYGGDPAPDIQAAFMNAAARIMGLVIGDLPDVVTGNLNLETNCGVTATTINETIDDVVIYAKVGPIDGPGKILGRAGPCLIRNTSRLTVVGVMEFDVDDLNNLASTQRLEPVILHEMLHVVGFGTLWDQMTPSLLVGRGGSDPRFTGLTTIQACQAAGGISICSGGVQVENCVGINGCGTGTRDSHWRELTFRSELMTGYVEATGVPMPLSLMTANSIGDLGYTINAGATEDYSFPNPALRALLYGPGLSADPEPFDILIKPTATISRTGIIQRLERQ